MRPLFKTLKSVRNRTRIRIHQLCTSLGSGKQCYVCGRTFSYFRKFRKGLKGASPFWRQLDPIDSDVEHFACYFCTANDRERHLFMYFDRLELWRRLESSRILHFAPERHLRTRIERLPPRRYVLADLDPKHDRRIQKIDATKIPFADGSFDFIICNHVLEHVERYMTALREFARVLTPGGAAILQTPCSRLLKRHFEEEKITTDAQRRFFYGLENHVRFFSEEQLLTDIQSVGFELKIVRHADCFDDESTRYFGVNPKEDLLMVAKPS